MHKQFLMSFSVEVCAEQTQKVFLYVALKVSAERVGSVRRPGNNPDIKRRHQKLALSYVGNFAVRYTMMLNKYFQKYLR